MEMCQEGTSDEGAVGARPGPAQGQLCRSGELVSLDLALSTVKQGGLAETRDPHLASLIPQLALSLIYQRRARLPLQARPPWDPSVPAWNLGF